MATRQLPLECAEGIVLVPLVALACSHDRIIVHREEGVSQDD